jgi:hypothetical protein
MTANNSGGDVAITLAAGSNFTTTGVGAHAIVAQSIGGGGGIADYATGATPSLSSTPSRIPNVSDGDGGSVSIDANASISTSGALAYGILAQSVGGGGGLVAGGNTVYAGSTTAIGSPGNGGAVTITQSGTISATGENSVGIFAQSTSAQTASATRTMIAVTVNGNVMGGSGNQGAGVWVDGGNSSDTLTIGSTGNLSALSGLAVNFTGRGLLDVNNNGILTGSVNLVGTYVTPSGNLFNNLGGTFNSGANVTANVVNDGVVAVWGSNATGPSAISGDFTQNPGAALDLEISGSNPSLYDSLAIDGYGDFNGTLVISFLNGFQPSAGDLFQLITSSDSTYAFSQIMLQGTGPSWVLQTEVSGNDFDLQVISVPEPSVIMLPLLAAGAMIVGRKRLRKRVS